MKKNKTYNMILTSIFGAIIFVLGMIPNVGYIRILPGVAITIVHIPVIIAMFVLPLSYVLGLGFIFGLSSLIVAATQATVPFDQAFVYPWISILPRLLFAFVGVYILKFFTKIKDFKYSKTIMFLIITVVTSFALYLGIQETVKNVNFSKSNDQMTEILLYKEVHKISDEEFNDWLENPSLINDIEFRVVVLDQQARLELEQARYPKVKTITMYVLIVIILGIIATYFYLVYFSKYSDKYFYVPSVFILSTFLHTIFVIGAVTLFKPGLFYEMLGNDTSLISVILGLALTNGLVEAIFGALIGSPIVVAMTNRLENE